MTIAAFLAFEPADADAARAVRAELERNGLAVGQSDPDLRTEAKAAALVQLIAEAPVVVVFASAAADASTWLRREVSAALSNGRPLVTLQTTELPPDSWLRPLLDVGDAADVRTGVGAEALATVIARAQTARLGGRVLAMLNIKGGVGKTVLAANLFAAAHLADKRSISFVDLDPQHNLTQYFLSPTERQRIRERNHTIHGVLTRELEPGDFAAIAVPLNRPKRAKTSAHFELIPGDERLFAFTLDARTERERAEALARLRSLVAALRARSDAIVIDVGPGATFLTRLAVSTADHIVAPARPEKYCLAGLNMLEQVVREIRGRPVKPSEFSVLLNGVNDRTKSGETANADALTRAEIGEAPFFSTALIADEIPYSAALKSAPSERAPANPLDVTAMMRVGERATKESLAHAAAAILRRAAP